MDILKNRNFLLLFLGRIFTNIGDSLYYVAAMWLVYKLSGNPFYSGLAGFLTLLPSALQFLTGPFVDRWPIKKHPRHHTSTAMHSNINHSYYTLLRPINRPTTTHHHAHRSLYRTIRLSCTVKSFTTSTA